METKNVTLQILESLKEAGVDKIFGIAGGGPTADLITMAPTVGIDFVLTQHETTAVITAGMYGQMKGTVGVAVSAIGPGVANMTNGAAHAWCDRLPVLMFGDRYSGGVHDVALRQQFDHLTMMRPVTKAQITLHEDTFMVGMRRAVRTALSERQGPVYIDIPGNVATKSVKQQEYKLKKSGGGNDSGAVINEADLKLAAERLSKSKAPIILAGIGALTLKPGVLAKLAAAYKAPVLTSPKAKGAIATSDPWCAGVFMGGKLEQVLLDRADTIFFVGYDPVELLPKPWSMSTFVVSLDSVVNNEQTFRSDIELAGDIGEAAARLTKVASSASGWKEKEIDDFKRMVIKAIDVEVKGMSPNAVILATREVTPKDTIMVTDVGANKLLVVELWDTHAPNDFHMSNGLATMGFCVPGAIAAKLAHPERPVVCLCGDAGFMMRLPDLLTVRRLNQKIVFVIFADDEHSLITTKQVLKGLKKYGMDFPRSNYQAMAETFGMKGVTVEDTDQLKKAIEAGLKHSTSTIIEARINPSGYTTQFDVIREL